MKVYVFGEENAPVILLLPGTCCHWKGNFGHVILLLSDEYRVLCVSYDGFDETERTEFPTMLEETAKIEDYLKANCGGYIRAAYGCSLGGSFVGLLASRGNVRMDYGILGSSDLDQSSKFAAKLQTDLLLPLMLPVLRDGKFKSPFLQKRMEKQMRWMGDCGAAYPALPHWAVLFHSRSTSSPSPPERCRGTTRPSMTHCCCMLPYFKEAREDFARIVGQLKK